MRGLPRSGIEPTSPALVGRFSTTEPPGKPPIFVFIIVTWRQSTLKGQSHPTSLLLWFPDVLQPLPHPTGPSAPGGNCLGREASVSCLPRLGSEKWAQGSDGVPGKRETWEAKDRKLESVDIWWWGLMTVDGTKTWLKRESLAGEVNWITGVAAEKQQAGNLSWR